MNPIFWREARVRPRAPLAPYWLPAACLPAAAILLVFLNQASGPDAVTEPAFRAFQTLACLQTLAWLVMAAASTAGSIASERERGLLESLQLSGMTSGAILAGKLAAALAFTALVILASLPVWALSMWLGGVSISLAARVALLHAAGAILGAAVGLLWSSWARRAATALRVSLISLAIWGVGSGLMGLVARTNGPQYGAWAAWCVCALKLGGATNPLAAAYSIADSQPGVSLLLMAAPSPALRLFDSLAAASPFLVSTSFQLLLAPVLLWLATRGIGASFDTPGRARRRRHQARPATSNPRKSAAPVAPVGPPFYDIPFVARLRFANPVLVREIRGKFRQPRVPRWVVIVQSLLGLAVLVFYFVVMWWAVTRPATRAQTWWVITFTALCVVMTAAPMMGAANFSRERERGTWEGVLLSPLEARAITGGKIGSALLAVAAFSLPVLPLLALCAGRAGGVSPIQALGTFALVAATAYAFSAFGTLLSWKAQRTAPVAAGMLLFVAVQGIAPFIATRPGWGWLVTVNPPSALAVLAGAGRAFGLPPGDGLAALLSPLKTVAALCGIGALCEYAVQRGLRSQGHP